MLHHATWKTRLAAIAAVVSLTGLAHAADQPTSRSSTPAPSSGGSSDPFQRNPYAAARFAKLMRGVTQGVIPSDEEVKALRIGDLEPWILSVIAGHRGMNDLSTRYLRQTAAFEPARLLTGQNLATASAREAVRGKLADVASLLAQFDADLQTFLPRAAAAMKEAYLRMPVATRSTIPEHYASSPATRMIPVMRGYVDLAKQRHAEILDLVQALDDHPDAFRLKPGDRQLLEFVDEALLKDFRARSQRIDALSERIQELFAPTLAQNESAERQLDETIRRVEALKP